MTVDGWGHSNVVQTSWRVMENTEVPPSHKLLYAHLPISSEAFATYTAALDQR
jgi:hypothetical protein